MNLKKVPKGVWVGGGIAAIVVIILWYEHQRTQGEEDPCDPTSKNYDASQCPPTEDTAQYPGKQMAVPSGAAGGVQYYLPLGYGSGTAPAKGSEDALPTEPTETLEEPNPIQESVNAPVPVGGGGYAPGSPVPGSTSQEGLSNNVPAGGGGYVPGTPVPGSTSQEGLSNNQPAGGGGGPAVAPAVPAPSGWCGHPNAVGMNQPCDWKNSHNPPSGWHWFCCNGMLGRAPN